MTLPLPTNIQKLSIIINHVVIFLQYNFFSLHMFNLFQKYGLYPREDIYDDAPYPCFLILLFVTFYNIKIRMLSKIKIKKKTPLYSMFLLEKLRLIN